MLRCWTTFRAMLMGKFLTVEEAADRLGVEYKTIYRLVRAGDIPAGKVGRIYRIREEDLDEYFERQKEQLAVQTRRTGLTSGEGRRCGACGASLVSEFSIAGKCELCELSICQACWAVRKIRRCAAHGAGKTTAAVTRSDADDGVDGVPVEPSRPHLGSMVERLRREGRPVVTADEAKLAEEAFVRAFAQRLEHVNELPDPLAGLAVPLRLARVKHVMEAGTRGAVHGPANTISRFTLRIGGWGKPKGGLVLEARFLARTDVLETQGYDGEPLGEVELNPVLDDLRKRAGKEDRFHVVSIGSPTGWSEPAVKIITQADHGSAFRDKRLGIGLWDLHADHVHLDENDDRLLAFWPLLAPARLARELTRIREQLTELVSRYDCVSLDYAAQECGGHVSWLRAAFDELHRTGQYDVRERAGKGLMLSRPLA